MSHRLAAFATALVVSAALTSGSAVVMAQDKDAKRVNAPHIHAAEKQLEHAENQLEKAEHVYGGHRAKALELVKQARHELRLAIQYAREHPQPPAAKK
jgi:hypothetical protein